MIAIRCNSTTAEDKDASKSVAAAPKALTDPASIGELRRLFRLAVPERKRLTIGVGLLFVSAR